MKQRLATLSAAWLAGLFLLPSPTCAWADKPWEETTPENWDEKTVEKVLESSPWVQTGIQVEDPFASSLAFRVRFLSALPVRLALQRRQQLVAAPEAGAPAPPEWTEGDPILVAVRVWCCADPASSGGRTVSALRRKALQRFPFDLSGSAVRARLVSAGQTVLEGDLAETLDNSADNLEVIFAFPRPAPDRLTDFEKETLRFQLELPGFAIEAKFKPEDMVYRDRLEL